MVELCPSCKKGHLGQPIDDPESLVCDVCGAAFGGSYFAWGWKPIRSHCRDCGKEVAPGTRTCPYCGSRLIANEMGRRR
jgi:hypothetical protein